MSRKINKNLKHLIKSYKDENRGAVLEGSSRSGKTFSSIDFIIYLCSQSEKPLTFNIIKETQVSFKTTLYDDFEKRLSSYGLDNPFERSKEITSFRIFNHKINFLGADKPSKFHGASCDFMWINEALDVSQAIFDQAEMRCRGFWWMDYNPSVSLHWIYDKVIPRDDVSFLKTTFLDNPFISKAELSKVKGYEPTPKNAKQGTADDYMWNVYGLGKRMSRTGLVFQNVIWIDEFPKDIERIGYSTDLGYTHDPTAYVKAGVNGNNLYAECLIYEPTENAGILAPMIKAVTPEAPYNVCDSADPVFISDLNKAGVRTVAIKKFPCSIKYGIGLIKSYNIHLVKNKNVQKEQENYSWKEINGIPLDEPIDKFNHFWDSLRYNCMYHFRK